MLALILLWRLRLRGSPLAVAVLAVPVAVLAMASSGLARAFRVVTSKPKSLRSTTWGRISRPSR